MAATKEEHLQNLCCAMDQLEFEGVTLKDAKCIFLAPSVEYIGDVIYKHGLQEKIRAIKEAPEPKKCY